VLARVVAAVAAVLGFSAPALASAEGAPRVAVVQVPSDVQPDGCLATVDRLSAYKATSAGTAIEIGKGDLTDAKADPTVDVTGSTGAGPVTAYKVEIELSYKRWTVLESVPGQITENASSWSNSFSVDAFTKYGIGIFRFHITTESAGKICFVSAYVKATQSSPFLTIAGAGASVGGLLSLYLFASYFGGIGFPQEISFAVSKKRRFFKPRIRPGPMLGGLLGGASALVILQQAGLVYPDTTLTLAAPLAGLVFSFLFTSTIRKRETTRSRKRADDWDEVDEDVDDSGAGGTAKKSKKAPSQRTAPPGKKSSGKGKNKPGEPRKRPTAQKPRPPAFTPTPMPPPPPQPNAGSHPSMGTGAGASTPAEPGTSKPSTAPFANGPTPLPPPPPPFLG